MFVKFWGETTKFPIDCFSFNPIFSIVILLNYYLSQSQAVFVRKVCGYEDVVCDMTRLSCFKS